MTSPYCIVFNLKDSMTLLKLDWRSSIFFYSTASKSWRAFSLVPFIRPSSSFRSQTYFSTSSFAFKVTYSILVRSSVYDWRTITLGNAIWWSFFSFLSSSFIGSTPSPCSTRLASSSMTNKRHQILGLLDL